MAACTVFGTVLGTNGEALSGVTVSARLAGPALVSGGVMLPNEQSDETDNLGGFSMAFEQSTSVIFTLTYPVVGTEPMRSVTYTGNIPVAATASFNDIVVVE